MIKRDWYFGIANERVLTFVDLKNQSNLSRNISFDVLKSKKIQS